MQGSVLVCACKAEHETGVCMNTVTQSSVLVHVYEAEHARVCVA